jgi:hypothetical protein
MGLFKMQPDSDVSVSVLFPGVLSSDTSILVESNISGLDAVIKRLDNTFSPFRANAK